MKEIRVNTLPNGYELTVDRDEYMCYSERQLLCQMFVHVGLQIGQAMAFEKMEAITTACATYQNEGEAMAQTVKQEEVINTLRRQLTSEKSETQYYRRRVNELTHENAVLRGLLKASGISDHDASKKQLRAAEKPEIKHVTRFEAGAIAKKKKYFRPETEQPGEVVPDIRPEHLDEVRKTLCTQLIDTGMPSRVLNVISVLGDKINHTVGDVVRYRRADLIAVHGCGRYVLEKLDAYLSAHHLRMGMDVDKILGTWQSD